MKKKKQLQIEIIHSPSSNEFSDFHGKWKRNSILFSGNFSSFSESKKKRSKIETKLGNVLKTLQLSEFQWIKFKKQEKELIILL